MAKRTKTVTTSARIDMTEATTDELWFVGIADAFDATCRAIRVERMLNFPDGGDPTCLDLLPAPRHRDLIIRGRVPDGHGCTFEAALL